jgi:hypothetical protein
MINIQTNKQIINNIAGRGTSEHVGEERKGWPMPMPMHVHSPSPTCFSSLTVYLAAAGYATVSLIRYAAGHKTAIL